MGEIVWGPDIPVNGVRPAWLADDVHVWRDLPCGPSERLARYISDTWWSAGNGNSHIRLPADHFAYPALVIGFEPWGGGDAAPNDWDGGDVLLRNGIIWKNPCRWRVGYEGSDEQIGTDIIGYRKRAEPTADTVTIARMTEAEVIAWWNGKRPGWSSRGEAAVLALRDLGVIREETLAERFTRETGHEVTPAVEAALTWLSQDTEAKG